MNPADEPRFDAARDLPWRNLPPGLQTILNADFLAKTFRRGARYKLADLELNDRRAAVIGFLTQVGPQSINDLAQNLEQQKAAVSAILIRMERDDLIEFAPNPQDKRSKNVALTEKGRMLSRPIREAFQELHDIALQGVPPADMEVAMRVLLRMIPNLSATDQPASR